MKKFKIMIIGAGVAGAILARRLSRIPQFEVCCLEKVSADDHSEAGTGLNVGPNAIKALLHTDPSLAEAVLAASLPWASWRVSLTDGRCLFDLPLAQVADNPGIRTAGRSCTAYCGRVRARPSAMALTSSISAPAGMTTAVQRSAGSRMASNRQWTTSIC